MLYVLLYKTIHKIFNTPYKLLIRNIDILFVLKSLVSLLIKLLISFYIEM